MTGPRSVKLNIDGIQYSARAVESDEYIRELTDLCNERIGEVARKYPMIGLKQRYTLALINTADQYLKLKQESDAMKKEIDNLASGAWK